MMHLHSYDVTVLHNVIHRQLACMASTIMLEEFSMNVLKFSFMFLRNSYSIECLYAEAKKRNSVSALLL